MTVWQLTDYDVEAVATQMKQGKSFEEIARNLEMSVEMVACAARKWPALQKRRGIWSELI